jgi:hypothetical protein
LATPDGVTRALQLLGHLPCEHFKIAGAKHAGGCAQICNTSDCCSLTPFIDRATGRQHVIRLKRDEVEPLPKYKHVRNEVTAAAGYTMWRIVTAEA